MTMLLRAILTALPSLYLVKGMFGEDADGDESSKKFWLFPSPIEEVYKSWDSPGIEKHAEGRGNKWSVPDEVCDLDHCTMGEQFLLENKHKPGWEVGEKGLQWRVIQKGDGGFRPAQTSVVSVHQQGRFWWKYVEWQRRLMRKKWTNFTARVDLPAQFKNDNDVPMGCFHWTPRGNPLEGKLTNWITGVQTAIGMMVEGEIRRVAVPAALAYGEKGTKGSGPKGTAIAKDETLVFEVMLEKISGEKIPASGCNPQTNDFEGCSEKETAYLNKMQAKGDEKVLAELKRVSKMVRGGLSNLEMDKARWLEWRYFLLEKLYAYLRGLKLAEKRAQKAAQKEGKEDDL